ncbi:MAG TPA: OmpA family protein, partial [Polyangiaceae bacterium]|nr:OmpA family protein [Polyangiaceae bacterium]
KLSEARAKSVAKYLVKKEGVDAGRLTSRGWGSEKPIASNDNEEGREKNRRVDFLVVDQEVTAKKVEIDPTTGKERVISEKKSELTDSSAAAADTSADTKKTGDAKKMGDAKKKPGKKGDAKKPEGSK